MMKRAWLLTAIVVAIVAAPVRGSAQDKDADANFLNQLFGAFFGPNWNVSLNGGVSTNGRYLLQEMAVPSLGQRALHGNTGWNLGLGAGVDLLPRTGFRLSYTYNNGDLSFKTDNGNGSDVLDIDDVGSLSSQTMGVEVIRYMLPTTAAATPYATVGFLGTWWNLDEQSPLVIADGGSTQFRLGAIASFGMQFRMSDGFSGRLEFATASSKNPFSGRESYNAFGGNTIDEPSRVNRTDWRIGGVYYFGRPEVPEAVATRPRRTR